MGSWGGGLCAGLDDLSLQEILRCHPSYAAQCMQTITEIVSVHKPKLANESNLHWL